MIQALLTLTVAALLGLIPLVFAQGIAAQLRRWTP